jgi:putative transposase
VKYLRRLNINDTLYFITVVTRDRIPILLNHTEMFWQSWNDYEPQLWVILPDHFHAILDVGNRGISAIIHDFKIRFSWRYRYKYKTGKIWQHRFWEHAIRDEKDLKNHIDYIHLNPVKHGIIDDPYKYKYSSLNQFVAKGVELPRPESDWKQITGDFGE